MTRHVNNIAIDPLDENYFISAGTQGDPVVSLWDRRFAPPIAPSTPSSEGPRGAVLELRPAIDISQGSSIWSLRFSGSKRGCFGILSSSGEIKIVDLAQHTNKASQQSTAPINSSGGSSWVSRHYVRYTHHVTHPWFDQHHGCAENSRAIAYDFVPLSDNGRVQSAIVLRPNRDVGCLKVPTEPAHVGITALDELFVIRNRKRFTPPTTTCPGVVEELQLLQDRTVHPETRKVSNERAERLVASRLDNLSIENFGHKAPSRTLESPNAMSSREVHEELVSLGYPESSMNVPDTLALLRVNRRRCKEGYLFDQLKNQEIVANDPWLVELWKNIKNFEDLAKDGGMRSESIDLSYLGVAAVWNTSPNLKDRFDPGTSRNRLPKGGSLSGLTNAVFANTVDKIVKRKGYPVFAGAQTAFPQHRQLCLAICGWTFSKQRVRQRLFNLMERGNHYKAIVIAVIRGYKDVARDLLRHATQQKLVHNLGLGAVIACESVNADQRDLCAWMADETDDPYLKALLAYFITGDWDAVASMRQLALIDRIGVALKYLDDQRLDYFIKVSVAKAKICGSVEGIVLTGLDEKAMDLFQNYIAKFNDLQTAVLVMAFAAPRYLSDPRFETWKMMYFMQMQQWQAFIERTRFVVEHNRKALSNDGKPLIPPAERNTTLRCTHCLAPLASRVAESPKSAANSDTVTITTKSGKIKQRNNPLASSGVMCSNCGRHKPRCGICMMWLGSPDPPKESADGNVHAGINTPAAGNQRRQNSRRALPAQLEDPMARQIIFCMACDHGFHGHHAKEWFARHQICAVPDCHCMCGVVH